MACLQRPPKSGTYISQVRNKSPSEAVKANQEQRGELLSYPLSPVNQGALWGLGDGSVVKRWLWKCEDLSSNPRTHIKAKHGPCLGRRKQKGPSGSLASQCSQNVPGSVKGGVTEEDPGVDLWSPYLHAHTQTISINRSRFETAWEDFTAEHPNCCDREAVRAWRTRAD